MRIRSVVSHIALALLISSVMVACSEHPKGVLGEEEMVELLVDFHKGEGLIDLQRARYSDDSMRILVKQSVMQAHGVSQAQLDTSLMWYGNHIEKYVEIYDKVIERIENEMALESGQSSRRQFAEGDSVNVWRGASSYRLLGKLPVSSLVFEIENASDWKPGDNYTLYYKGLNHRNANDHVPSAIYVEYEDGSREFRTGNSVGNNMARVRLVTDSTKMARRVYGYISIGEQAPNVIYLDSVSLVRTRLQPETYRQRMGQRSIPKIEPAKPIAPADSLDTISGDGNKIE